MLRWFCLVVFLGTAIGGGAGFGLGTLELMETPGYWEGQPMDSSDLIPRVAYTFEGLFVGFFGSLVGFVELTGLRRRLERLGERDAGSGDRG